MRKIGLNASRTRSGGGIVHLEKILENFSFNKFPDVELHIWGYENILIIVPDNKKFIKHIAFSDSKSLAYQLIWEKFILPRELTKNGCDLLINLDAGSFCRFIPNITMSRDMLSYERGIMKNYFFSVTWLRLRALKYVQVWSLKNASKAVFLTNYAQEIIQKTTKHSFESVLIPHGIDKIDFNDIGKRSNFTDRCKEVVYISNFDLYKNQDCVIRAFKLLFDKYANLRLHLVGAFTHKAFYRKCIELANNDERIIFHGSVKHSEVQSYLFSADVLLFASSCENMPNTLLEYMSAKKPILCSNRGPMPEVLGDWNYYFNPEDVNSIVFNLDRLMNDFSLWNDLASLAFERVEKYSWKKCSDALFNLANEILDN